MSASAVLALIAAVAMLRWSQEVMIPVLLGIFISYALEPIVIKLAGWKIHRVIGSTVVLAIVLGGIALAFYILSDDLAAIIDDLPEATRKLKVLVLSGDAESGIVEKVQEAAEELETTAKEAAGPGGAPRGVSRVQIEEKPLDLSQVVWWGSMGILGGISQLVLLLFLVYFLLISGDLFRRKLVGLAGPTLERRKVTLQILNDINCQIRSFVLVQIFTGVVVGTLSWLAFAALGLRGAAVWGIAAGVFNSIPYVGPLIVAVGVVTITLVQFGTLSMVVYVAIIAFAITSLEGWLLTPWLMGRAVRMNGVSVFIGLLFFTWLWGVWGMLLAVPTMAVVKSICDHVEDLKPMGELLGE